MATSRTGTKRRQRTPGNARPETSGDSLTKRRKAMRVFRSDERKYVKKMDRLAAKEDAAERRRNRKRK